MGRETSPYIVGDYWLDKRRDGRSPDVWQIASYDARTRSISYRSTRRKDLDQAKAAIHAHVEAERSRGPQTAEGAKVVPLLFLYWTEHGKTVVSPDQIASSLRVFIGFLLVDEVGPDLTIADVTPQLFERFRRWRMGPHSYEVPWGGKTFKHTSKGVRGESVQRNLDDIRAALTHHANNGRLPYAPKVPAVRNEFRSQPRDRVLSMEELGAIFGFARSDLALYRWLLLQLATGVRPEAGLAFDPAVQWNRGLQLLDLHPPAWARTKKVNPVVPAIGPMVPILEEWAKDKPAPVASRKRAWRTLRRALDLGAEVMPKTIRHTIATRLRTMRVPSDEIETLLGHRVLKKTTAVYAKYDPDYLASVRVSLATVFEDVMVQADLWSAGHLRAKVGNEPTKVLRLDSPEAAEYLAKHPKGGA